MRKECKGGTTGTNTFVHIDKSVRPWRKGVYGAKRGKKCVKKTFADGNMTNRSKGTDSCGGRCSDFRSQAGMIFFRMFSRFIFECNVVGLSPNNWAAPPFPPTFQAQFSRILMM